MNFFEHQDQARRKTGLLVFLFILAVVSLILLTNLLVVLVMLYIKGAELNDGAALIQYFSLRTLIGVSGGILSVVLIASLFKLGQLGRGGRAIAEAMGGRLINLNTQDSQERRVLNVVEEMAIASGTPVPPVYLMDEEAINAFAAGYQPSDAVIGVTRGCIQLLDRDELQGVMAHEFSHILHGDMRLNIRLIGVLHGILVIGIIGQYLLRSVSRSGYRSRSGKNNGALPLLLLGGGLTVIGYAGTFFGNLIKAAVGRQREYLADASAVQFTRNPQGISGALKKIGGFTSGSQLFHPNVSEISHLFFGQAIKPFLGSLLATHPPLMQRIKRIEPQWDGVYPQVMRRHMAVASEQIAGFADAAAEITPSSSTRLLDGIGQIDPAHLDYAKDWIRQLPADIYQAASDPFGARALVYCLLLDRQPAVEQKQRKQLERQAEPLVIRMMQELDSERLRDPGLRLSLVDLCLPALAQLSDSQYSHFKQNLVALMHADNEVALFEWALYRIIIRYLEPEPRHLFDRENVGSFKSVNKATGLVLSALAEAGAASDAEALTSFQQAKRAIGLPRLQFIARNEYQVKDLSRAVAVLNRLKPLLKPKLLKALCLCVTHDGVIKPVEAELVRAIADSLHCPMPPLIPDQTLL